MKIAIVSDDSHNIASHFGRAKGFVIAEIQDNKVVNKEYRNNTFTHHHHSHNGGHNESHNHSHQGILDALVDCEAVISKGIGRRLYADLESVNKKIFVTSLSTVDEALQQFIEGNLDDNPENCCEH